MPNQSILITGGTGFLGSALSFQCLQQGRQVSILSRSAEKVARAFGNKVTAITRIDELPDASQFSAVVNLAGAGIFDQRWTDARKQVLRDSRIQLTEKLVGWIAKSDSPPAVLVSGSAIGYYGEHGDEVVTENAEPNIDFSQNLCADWEHAALKAQELGTRVCIIRTGLVLGKNGGLLKRMLFPFRFGLGGRMGNGQQWMSWIHLHDWLAIVQNMVDNPNMSGPYNATAPNPVTNQTFSECLAAALNRPMLLPLPEALLKPLLGEMAALVLGSQRVVPQYLLDQGFEFEFSELEPALQAILSLPH